MKSPPLVNSLSVNKIAKVSFWNSTGLLMKELCGDWSQIFASFLQASEVLTKEAIQGSFKVCHEAFAGYYPLQWKTALLRAVNHVLYHFGSYLCHEELKKWRLRKTAQQINRTLKNDLKSLKTGTSNQRSLMKDETLEKQKTYRAYFRRRNWLQKHVIRI